MKKRADNAIILFQDIDQFIAGFFGLIQGVLVSFASMIAPWAVPLAPAAFAAYAVYGTALKQMDPGIAWWVGVATAIGLETVGISAAHTTVDLYNAWRDGRSDKLKVFVGTGLVLAYFVAGISVILLLEGTPLAVKVVGTGAFVLALISYIGQVLRADVRRIARNEQVESQAENLRLDHELRADAERIRLDHERAMQKDRLNAEIRLEKQRTLAEAKRNDTEMTTIPQTNPERSAEYNSMLDVVREQSGGNSFGANDIQQWLGKQKTATYDLIKYGKQAGRIHQVGRGRYTLNGAER
jgi:hypothetical protein